MEINALRELIKKQVDDLGSYRKAVYGFPGLADSCTAPHVILNRIVLSTEYEPSNPEIRKALLLPVLIPTPACECGEVHAQKSCKVVNRSKRLSSWKRLSDLSKSDLLFALENREDFSDDDCTCNGVNNPNGCPTCDAILEDIYGKEIPF